MTVRYDRREGFGGATLAVVPEDARRLMLLSRSGIVHRTPLERLWLRSPGRCRRKP